VSLWYFRCLDPRGAATALFAVMKRRPGTMVVAGALKLVAVLLVVGAVVGVAFFRSDLLELVPFVGAKGLIAPAVFTLLVAAVAVLFWALAEGLGMLAAHADAHAGADAPRTEKPAPVALLAADPETPSHKFLGVGDVPGFRRYQSPKTLVMKWTANVTVGPAYLAVPVCEVSVGESVTALGELAEFAFVETTAGNGWLPKDALAA
jgi:hypothetical protein